MVLGQEALKKKISIVIAKPKINKKFKMFPIPK